VSCVRSTFMCVCVCVCVCVCLGGWLGGVGVLHVCRMLR
jgi:hypothetical protein